jgi:hypothetical protein
MAQQTNIKNSNLWESANNESHSRMTSVIKETFEYVEVFMNLPLLEIRSPSK